MKELKLKDSIIRIRAGLAGEAGPLVHNRLPSLAKALVVTDENVRPIADRVASSLKDERIAQIVHEIPKGESHKTLESVREIYGAMLAMGLERGSAVVAVGGGVVGDMAGFAAATWMRGIPVVQIPTTLLAQVDASIGGKTGVDFEGYKNLIGSFHQPSLVLIDPELLSTLPDRDFRTGLAEVIKYGVIRDAALFESLEKTDFGNRDAAVLEPIIARCAEIKVEVVDQDEKEGGLRAILNFGHTVGHAIESIAEFKITHGEAVASGMASETRIAIAQGLTKGDTLSRIESLVGACGLPTRADGDPAAVLKAIRRDKKTKDGRPRFVLPESIGKVRYGVEVPDDVVAKALA